jgi:uncharacterized protein YcgI (DUF1989 family)
MALQTIPACHGVAIELDVNAEVVVINTYGTQVLDTWAFSVADPDEHLSMEHTRSCLSRLSPSVGDSLITNRRQPVLTMLEDTSPGIHDTLLCACNQEIYRELGCDESHRNCESNLHEALSTVGIKVSTTPAPLNLFMNVPVAADGAIDRRPPQSRPGDRVRLRADMQVVIVFSACPQDITPINGAECIPRDAHYEVISQKPVQ